MEAGLNAITKPADPFKELKTRAKQVGLSWAAVKPYLPDWAEDAAPYHSGLMELEGFIARHFGFRLLTNGGFESAPLPHAQFKLHGGTAEADVANARQFATSVARMIAKGCNAVWNRLPRDAHALRQLALHAAATRGWVDFPALVEISWASGVPVLYLNDLPTKGKRPAGMVTFVGGRPVVVLLKKQEQPEWMLFILAHELGHIALGHLGTDEGDAVVDESVGEGDDRIDAQENDANVFAANLLVDGGISLKLGTWPKAEQLATAAQQYGREYHISPGHVVLNAVRHSTTMDSNLYPLAVSTLKILQTQLHSGTTAEICRDAARRHLDTDALKFDTLEFLEKLKVI